MRCSASGSTPRSVQRAIRSRSSVANPTVLSAGRSCVGQRHHRVVAVLEVTREQFADDAVLLGAGDQPRRRVTIALGSQPKHRERVRVHRAHERLPDHRPAARAQQRRRDRRAGLCTQPRRTRQQQNRFRVEPRGDVCGRGTDQQAALTRACAAEHPDDAAQARFDERCGRQIGVRCGHGGMTPRGSDKWPHQQRLAASQP